MPPATPPAQANFSAYKPLFVRELGAVSPRPTLARFEVGGGLRVLLRDAQRRELVVQVAPSSDAPGSALRSELSAVDVLDGALSAEDAPGWVEAVAACVRMAEEAPGWGAFLAAAWATPARP
jgi:hypothetical protein